MRDGNRLLCPCCGQVLLVLKEKRFAPPKMHHMQGDPRRTWPALEKLIAQQEAYLNASPQEAAQEESPAAEATTDGPFYRADALVTEVDPKIAAHQFPPLEPPPFDPRKIDQPVKQPAERSSTDNAAYQPPRDWNTRYDEHQRRQSKRPLAEPTTYEMARLYAWAYYRLQRLAVQLEKQIAAKEAEVQRLQAKLNEQNELPAATKETSVVKRGADRSVGSTGRHAHADEGMAPRKGCKTIKSRGSENRRHAQADMGMDPATDWVGPLANPSEVSPRGPP